MKHKKRRTTVTSNDRSAMPAPSPRLASRTARSWSLNLRLLVISVLIVLIAVPSLVAFHSVQVRLNAAALFDRAKQLESEGNFAAAAETLFRYLKFRPYDGPARVVLAQVFDKGATHPAAKQRAAEHYLAALGHAEDRTDLRVRLAEILLELGRHTEAQDECLTVLFGDRKLARPEMLKGLAVYENKLEAAKLLTEKPDADTALRLLAYAWYQQTAPRGPVAAIEVVSLGKIALAVNPNDIRLAELVAETYREQLTQPDASARARLADDVMAKLAVAQPKSGLVQLSLYRYRTKYGLAEAASAIEQALALEPDNVDIVLSAANAAERRNEHATADRHYVRAAELRPTDPRSYVGRASSLLRRNLAEEAIAILQDAMKQVGINDLSLRLLLVQANLQTKKFDDAEKSILEGRQRLEEIGPLLGLAARTELKENIEALEAERLIGVGHLNRAAPLLRQLAVSRSQRNDLNDDGSLRAHRWQRLAEVYVQLGYHELAAQAFEKQAESTKQKTLPRLAAAEAWQTVGRLDLALELFAAAMKHPQAPASGWTSYARAMLDRQRQSGDSDWSQFNSVVTNAKAANAGSVDLAFVEAQAEVTRNQRSEAVAIIERTVASDPTTSLPIAVLAYQSMGETERADQAFAALRQLPNGDAKSISLLEAELHRRRSDFAACRKILQSHADDASDTEKPIWLRRIASVKLQAADGDIKTFLTAIVDKYPNDLWSREQLAELALQKKDFADLEQRELALQAIEGADGSLWRFFRGMRLASKASSNSVSFQEAARIQQELEGLRPAWSGTLQLKGWLAQQLGQVEEAADAYRRAIQAGARNVTVFEGLISVLYAGNRWAEADQYLKQLQNVGFDSPNLEALSPRVLLQSGNFDQAIAAARSGAQLRPKDPLAQIWLGQTLAIAAERTESVPERTKAAAEAQKAFDLAVQLAPTDYRSWSGLLWFHARQNNQDEARRAIDGLRRQAKLAEPQRLLALAQAFQLLGDFQEAEKSYLAALALLPKDKALHERLARFYLSFSPDKAEQAYRRLLELDPSSKSAKRNLAILLAVQGTEDRYAEAVALLETSSAETTDTRLQAIFLLKRGKPDDLTQARRLLEPLVKESTSPQPTDRRLLAAVYEAQKEIKLAKAELAKLVEGKPAPVFLAAYVDFLIRNNLAVEAEESVKRLNEVDPSSIQTARSHATWLQALGKPSQEVLAVVQQFQNAGFLRLTDGKQAAIFAREMGRLCSELKIDAQGELVFREALKRFPENGLRQSFATWLLEHGKIDDAVQLADQHVQGSDNSADSIQLLSNVLTFAANEGRSFADAEHRLEAAIEVRGSEGNLAFEFATLRHMQGRTDEAIALYRQALRKTPQNVLLLNNLAMVLLEVPGGEQEALQFISRAISLAGPINELRDTQALVLGKAGKSEEARRMLKGLVALSPGSARYQFHLAAVCVQVGGFDEAVEALRQAKLNKLDRELLTPFERTSLKNIEQQLADFMSKSTVPKSAGKSQEIGSR